MVNSIIKGIAKKLNETFGAGYKIYKEDIEQNFVEPCFSIVHIMSINSGKLPHRYLRTNRFNVQFFPESNIHAKNDIYEVAEKMLLEMEYITVDGNLCRGTDMRYEIEDGVLHFFVNYNLFIKKEQEKVPMLDLQTNSGVEA